MIKTCVICGKEFDATRAKKTCSKECSDELDKRSDLKAAQAANQRRQQLQQAKSGWLTIPDAPDYEINSKLQVRNKVTGHMLKLQTGCKTKHYALTQNTVTGKFLCRSPKSLFRQAVAALLPMTLSFRSCRLLIRTKSTKEACVETFVQKK